jgi:integral membrane sensor domain MASE1
VGNGLEFWLSVQSWWIGDFLGALIVTPLILTIGFHGLSVDTHAGRPCGYLLGVRGAVVAARGRVPAPHTTVASLLDVPYIAYPVLVWIAMLGGPRRTALAAGITVAIAALATTRGLGPFEDTYQLQTFLALCVLPVLCCRP